MDFNERMDYLIECGIATEKEIRLICYINGWTCETLNSICWALTGYEDVEDLRNDN